MKDIRAKVSRIAIGLLVCASQAVFFRSTIPAHAADVSGATANQDISGSPAGEQKPAVENRPVKDKWALVVGISKFANPKLNLRCAAKDAEDFYKYLTTEGNFAPDHVKLLTDEKATQREILSELGNRWLPRVANPDDLVVIYVSSHGSASEMDVGGVNYIVAHDTDIDDLYTTGIEMQELARTIKRRVHSDRVVVILDACHSGAANADAKGLTRMGNLNADDISQGSGQLVISSSQPSQVSWELKDQSNSAFTTYLIAGLKKQGDGTRLGDAFGFMKDKVQETVLRERGVLQTPVLKSQWQGNELVLAVRPSQPRPGLVEPLQPPPATTAPSKNPSAPAGSSSASAKPGSDAQPVNASVTINSLQPKVAVLPFTGPLKTNIGNFQGTMFWGNVMGPGDFAGLPTLLSQKTRDELASKLKDRVIDPRGLLAENPGQVPDPNCQSAEEWQRIGRLLGTKYIVCGTVDEVRWTPGTMANKYSMIVSVRLVSGQTGHQIWQLNQYQIVKAPFFGDMRGGRVYFEEVLAPAVAEHLTHLLTKAIPAN
jgi:hypothetical protein